MALEQKNGKKGSRRSLYIILIAVFGIALAVCLGILIRNAVVKNRAHEQFDKLAAQSTEPSSEQAEPPRSDILAERGIVVPEKNLDWDELKETNEDIYAWIYIPGTNVDYPVLQDEEDDNYYLDHNLDGSSGYPGCIYSQSINDKTFTDPNTVLYGHNMKDGSMFKSLHEYEDNTFFEENQYIYIYTPEETLVYEVYTACEFSDAHIMFAYEWWTTEGFKQFVEDITSVRAMNAHVRDDVSVTPENHLITLSTCINGKPNNRWIVTGVLVNDPGVVSE